jgi:hypothetical protein
MPPTSVWQILKKRLHKKPYRLQLLQAVSENDKEAHTTFCVDFLGVKSAVENLMFVVVFSDKAIFHVSGKVNVHNCCIWALQNPRTSEKLQ